MMRKLVFMAVALMLVGTGLCGCTSPFTHTSGRGAARISGAYDSESSAPLDLRTDLGLNDSTISKIGNDTLFLKITFPESNSTMESPYYVTGGKATLPTGGGYHDIHSGSFKGTASFSLSIQFFVRSPYPEVRSITLAGTNNTLNFTVKADYSKGINVVPAPGFEAFGNLVTPGYESTTLVWAMKHTQAGNSTAVTGQCIRLSMSFAVM